MSIIESFVFTSNVATFISVSTLVLTGHFLSPSTAFMVLAFTNVLRLAVSIRLGVALPLMYELFVSFQRIERFLLLDNMPPDPLKYSQRSYGRENTVKSANIYPQLLVREPSPKDVLAIRREISGNQDTANKLRLPARLRVSSLTCILNELNGEKYLLRDVSFEASEKSLTVITGRVGSGKSSLLAAIAGEVIKSSGNIVCSGTIAYVPQTAWVFPGTLRENVLFGEPYDEMKYTKVIEACALTEDINRFPNGDLSFVGEHGVALSGGQRARVNLARAAYADADVYLLDDPLSAVDAKVCEHIFRECICQLLEDKLKILATYIENNMKSADQVVVLHGGSGVAKGSFYKLQDGGKVLDSIIDASVTPNKERIIPGTKEESETAYSGSSPLSDSFDEHLQSSEEEKAIGNISSTLYWDYFRAGMHPIVIIVVVAIFLATQG